MTAYYNLNGILKQLHYRRNINDCNRPQHLSNSKHALYFLFTKLRKQYLNTYKVVDFLQNIKKSFRECVFIF